MKVHLFGFPLPIHRRLKEESAGWCDALPAPHEFRATPIDSIHPRPLKSSDIRELRRIASEDFVHIVFPPGRDWMSALADLQFDFRIHVLRLSTPAKKITWNELREALYTIVDLDQEWLERIAPTDLRHSLLLPPSHFEPSHKVGNFWKSCDTYVKAQFEKVEELLKRVERIHRKHVNDENRVWVDERNRCYEVDRSFHGRHEAERRGERQHRFCLPLPPGFHYDVTNVHGKSFEIRIGAALHSVTHVNISPWGAVRS